MTRTLSAAFLVALLTFSAGPAAAALSVPRLPGAPETVPGELIVKFKPSVAVTGRAASLAAAGHTTISALGNLGAEGWTHVRVAPGQTDAQALAAYAGDPNVEFAQPNFIYRASAVPNDPQYRQLWGWRNSGQTIGTASTQPAGSPIGYPNANPGTAGSDMNLEKAWNLVTDCSGVVVAVIDSGVNYTHVDLAANMWAGNPEHGKNFADDVAVTDPMDLNGHGTHVAGTIGAVGNNGLGVTGVCWKATIMAVRVLGADGSGSSTGIIQGVDFAVNNGAKVLNMSFGGGGSPDSAYQAAIGRAQSADVVVVVAAGNDVKDNEATPVYPCNFTNPNLICVAALDQAFGLASFSNWGATSVDVGAPGTNIVSTWNGPVFDDPLDSTTIPSSWTFWSSPAVAGGGWARSSPGITPNLLVDPGNFDTSTPGSYRNSTDDRAWRTFTQPGLRLASMSFQVVFDIATGDHFRSAWSTGGDPFLPGGHVVTDDSNLSTYPNASPRSVGFSGCGGATCTFGIQLQSDATPQTFRGVGVGWVALGTVRTPGTDYNTENGTSMATPAVAGLATMLRAFHGPAFTAADTIGAIKGGGRATAALTGKTTTGKAADAMGALAFINPPSGVTATVR